MKLESMEPITENKGKVVILSETEPENLAGITGADVEGLADDYIIAIGSAIVTPSKTYIAFEDGNFKVTGSAAVPIGG